MADSEAQLPRRLESPRSSLPIVSRVALEISNRERARLDSLAVRIAADEPAFAATDAFGPLVSSGQSSGPALLIGDHSEIPLALPVEASVFEYRMLLLANDGDFLVLSGERYPRFEDYCRRVLRRGRASFLELARANSHRHSALADRCAGQAEIFSQIVTAARDHGGITIMPDIGMDSSWNLAASIAKACGAQIRVCAPPPRLTRRVNDKLWFSERVADVLGSHSQPKIYYSFGPAALTAQVATLAKRFRRVVVKVPDASGSAGNLSLDAASVRNLTEHELRRRLLSMLQSLGWQESFPLLVGVWECSAISSPSVQIWIPQRKDGLPVVEGIFEQFVEHEQGEFVGARPAILAAKIQSELAAEAGRLAYLFQQLGYFGRCSFDAILIDQEAGGVAVHWIECNGRWGGVSVPMTLANGLQAGAPKLPFTIVQRTEIGRRPEHFGTVLSRLGNLAYRPDGDGCGVVLLSPGGIETGTGSHFMAFAETVTAAQSLATKAASIMASGGP